MAQLTTLHGRNSMAKAFAGDAAFPKVAGLAFGTGGHDPSNPVKDKALTAQQVDLFKRVIVIPIETHSYPGDGIVRFSLKLTHDKIPGNSFSEAALVDESGKALAIQTFGLKTIGPNEEFYYDWEEVC
ncbi:hypothetical protein J5TS2_38830 [Brevibacillus halotolerans]|uniref:hypothetical protein n=1 Tax=Brevibacillus halotolerans TaxID=1507437 RepID=UPI001B21DC7F|nr:hypothetical protein [Brevibacillus halotolerans]GIO03215.1 hypothetical protein J5TS2_38830 [Brevibacillus halotolerans]